MRCIPSILAREHYRRLTLPEIRKVLSRLKDTKHNDYADMVVIGYYTGLRLSDVAELECGEVSPDGTSLWIMPNKVRNCRAMFLSVPLIHGARECVQRRLRLMSDGGCTDIDQDGHRYLFPKSARCRPSRPISAAFRACGVLKIGNGRASFHSLRATFISLMDEAGVSPHITDAITGHSNGGMHARYTQPTPSALIAAVQGALPVL